jgi:hypothetical protein
MKKIFLLALALPIICSCGNGSTTVGQDPVNNGDPGVLDTPQDPVVVPELPDAPAPPEPNLSDTLNSAKASAAASGFCDSQKQLRILSTSLLSAYASKGNGADTNYCGGSAEFTQNGPQFGIALADYCVNARGQQVTLNGIINGVTESGANFTSDIVELTIEGAGVNMSLDGDTYAGRADDMFMNLNISDLVNAIETGLEGVNIKKGEFDLGYLVLPNVGRFYFKFITHFNGDWTEGMLFIYGEGEQVIIVSADNGTLTVVYKETRHDAGTLLTQTSCGS